MKLWKRNVVVAAIVLFVCVAVYLNWTYDQEAAVSTSGDTSTSTLSSEDGESETKTLGEAALVSSEDTEDAEETSGDSEEIVIDSWDSAELTEETEAAAVGESGDSSGYFAEARLSREEARASALSILQETVDDPEASEAAVSAAADSITAMASATLAESQIESLVTAKGYPECVAFIGDNSVSVVVSTESGELSGADVAKITDIVLGETDFPASAVKVVLAED
ncbi:MAG: SpoIIIAH-like family protein [Clostridiales bacterium]|nr:SpoIIIAH-like family protein [Clostridiales bacterium]